MGLTKPTVSYGHQITVDKPIEEAWAVMMDESKFDQWLEGFKSMELIEGKKNTPGSKHKIVVVPQEGEPAFEMIETLESLEKYDHVKMNYDNEFMVFKQMYTFSESNGKTTIKSDASVTAKTFMMRCMLAVMETFFGSFSTQEAKNMEALRDIIKENTTDYSSKSQMPAELDSMSMDSVRMEVQ